MRPCGDCKRHVRLGTIVCPFCAVALTVLSCHRTTSDAGPGSSTHLAVDSSGSRAPVYGGPPIDQDTRLLEAIAALGDAGSSPPPRDAGLSPVRISMTVEGPTASGDERSVAGLRQGFVSCAASALDAGAPLPSSFVVVVTIGKSGEILSASLTDPKLVEADCLIRKTKQRSFEEGPERTLRIVVKQSLAP